jgi:hypothetical protein
MSSGISNSTVDYTAGFSGSNKNCIGRIHSPPESDVPEAELDVHHLYSEAMKTVKTSLSKLNLEIAPRMQIVGVNIDSCGGNMIYDIRSDLKSGVDTDKGNGGGIDANANNNDSDNAMHRNSLLSYLWTSGPKNSKYGGCGASSPTVGNESPVRNSQTSGTVLSSFIFARCVYILRQCN